MEREKENGSARVSGLRACTVRHGRRGERREGGARVGNARRRRSVSRMCVSTSLMPRPGPPLREREGMMRRGRAGAAPPVFEPDARAEAAEAEAGAEGPACEVAADSVLEGPAPPPLADADVDAADADAAGPAAGVAEFAGEAATTPAGSAVDADARLGMRPRRRGHEWVFFGGWG